MHWTDINVFNFLSYVYDSRTSCNGQHKYMDFDEILIILWIT